MDASRNNRTQQKTKKKEMTSTCVLGVSTSEFHEWNFQHKLTKIRHFFFYNCRKQLHSLGLKKQGKGLWNGFEGAWLKQNSRYISLDFFMIFLTNVRFISYSKCVIGVEYQNFCRMFINRGRKWLPEIGGVSSM